MMKKRKGRSSSSKRRGRGEKERRALNQGWKGKLFNIKDCVQERAKVRL